MIPINGADGKARAFTADAISGRLRRQAVDPANSLDPANSFGE
jgi:hypothetical protein